MESRLWEEFDNGYDEARKYAAPDLVSAFNVVVVGDLLFDPDTMNFGEFMRNSFIPQIAFQRRSGYLRLRLRTSALDPREISVFIRKVDLYVVAIYDGAKLYEIGFRKYGARYFHGVWFTEFSEKYSGLFPGRAHLRGISLGFKVLRVSIHRIITNHNCRSWKNSLGIFALTFSESGRFHWNLQELARVMDEMTDIKLIQKYDWIPFLAKRWKLISWCARRPGRLVGRQHPIKTFRAAEKLLDVKSYAIDALIFQTWDYQDFNHLGLPNMPPGGGGHGGGGHGGDGHGGGGHGGGGPHDGGSRGGGSHGGNYHRSGDSSRSVATHPSNRGGASRRCGGKFYGGRQGYGTSGHGSLAFKKLQAFEILKHKKGVDVYHLTSSSSAEVNLDDTDVIPSEFENIADTFINIPVSLTSEMQEKGLMSEIEQLKQNFRTHAGVLDLAQSVIDIMYHYYIQSIDKLEPEISLISGETPVLLESRNDENAIVAIFGGSGSGEDIVGFGAEQVILVRDDRTKTEVCEFVGTNALVLTIVECKGLEFQDVLLYNFFGTSPLKDQWRVIYGYIKKYDWLEDKLPQSFPAFNEGRHSVLCSELKQLYVAVTRTRQRLWICENNEKLSKPMFDYWKKRGLVGVRKLDDSVAQAMQVASTAQEWRERGKKFFCGNNFIMATMCFEKAGDTMWEKLSKASGLRASAYQMRETNHEAFERAGKSYVSTCGKIVATAECFLLAGCYKEAAEAYAKDDKISNCLSVCKEGKLYEKGLQYINYWKEHASFQSKEIQQIEQEFLESCALFYHEHKDPKSMMKFVRAFCSMESNRVFLRSLGCLDDLLLLQEESGHFTEAAELARSWGDLLKEANRLEKVGSFKEAANILLCYVCFRASWGNGNRGWPLRQFDQMEEICDKVKSLAKMHSVNFYDFVCNELKVMSDQHNSLPELKKDLHASQKIGSFRGEILSSRKILDAHFHLHFTKYEWEDELPTDITEHCDQIFENKVSVRTLVFYWNMCKENAVDILKSLGSFHKVEPNKHHRHLGFSLIHFGVRECYVNGNIVYVLIDKDAEWRRNYGQKGLHKDGKHVTIDAKELVFALQSYWQSELLSVGIKILETLEGLHKSKSNAGLLFGLTGSQSYFHRSMSLLHIYEVSKFLLDCQYLNVTNPNTVKLKRFLEISLTYFDLVFPLDWRNVVSQNLVSLRETDLSVNLLEEIILQLADINLLAVGRMIMICLGSRLSLALYEHLIKKLKMNPQWKSFVEKFRDGGFKDVYVAPALQNALEGNFSSKSQNYASIKRCFYSISPHSFVYLLDRLLSMHSFSSGYSYTTRSSFVESFTHIHSDSTLSIGPSSLNPSFLVELIRNTLYPSEITIMWIQQSNIDGFYYPLLVLKLVMILSLICLKVPDYSPVPLEFLYGYDKITYFLPKKFVCDLLRKRKKEKLNLDPEVVAEAFISIDDPLLILSSENVSPEIDAPCAIFVDLRKSKEEIESVLFPWINTLNVRTSANNAGTIPEVSSSNTLPDTYLNVNTVKMQMNWKVLEEICNAKNGKKGVAPNKLPTATMIKAELDMNKTILITAFAAQKICSPKDATLVRNAKESLKVLSFAFDPSREEANYPLMSETMELALNKLQSYKRKIDKLLNRAVTSQVSKVEQTSESVVVENQSDNDNTQDGTNKKGKGNKGQKSKKSRGKKK